MQGRDRERLVPFDVTGSRLQSAMRDIEDDPVEELAATMAQLRAATERRRLLPRGSTAYADAVAEEMQLNDRILELA
jgi:hypothetical protein